VNNTKLGHNSQVIRLKTELPGPKKHDDAIYLICLELKIRIKNKTHSFWRKIIHSRKHKNTRKVNIRGSWF